MGVSSDGSRRVVSLRLRGRWGKAAHVRAVPCAARGFGGIPHSRTQRLTFRWNCAPVNPRSLQHRPAFGAGIQGVCNIYSHLARLSKSLCSIVSRLARAFEVPATFAHVWHAEGPRLRAIRGTMLHLGHSRVPFARRCCRGAWLARQMRVNAARHSEIGQVVRRYAAKPIVERWGKDRLRGACRLAGRTGAASRR